MTGTGQGTTAGMRRGGVLALCVAQLLDTIDANIVVVALPAVGRELGFSAAALTWVVTGYVVMFGSLMILAGRVADRIGARGVLMAGVALFALSSCVCALAEEPAPMLVGRLAQGVAAAMMSGTALALIVRHVPKDAQPRALGLWTASAAVGGALSLLLGGLIVDGLGWRWIFWVNLPICALGLLGLLSRVPTDRMSHTPGERSRFSAGSTVLAALLCVSLLGGLSLVSEAGATRLAGIVAIVLPVLLAPLALRADRRSAEPVLDRRLVRDRDFVTGVLATLLGAASVPPAIVVVSVVLQFAHRNPATTVGLALLPFSVLVIAGSSIGGGWLAAGRRPGAFVTFGTMCTAALAGLAVALDHRALWPVPVLMGVLGLGFGAVAVAATTVALRSVPAELGGTAGAIVNTTTQLAVAGGIAAFVTAPVVLSGATSASSISAASVPHLRVATAVAAACCLCLALLDLRSSARRRGAREAPTISVERSST